MKQPTDYPQQEFTQEEKRSGHRIAVMVGFASGCVSVAFMLSVYMWIVQ